TYILYTIRSEFVKLTRPMVLRNCLSVYKLHETRGLRPGRRVSGRAAHAFLDGMAAALRRRPDRPPRRLPVGYGGRLGRLWRARPRRGRAGPAQRLSAPE